MCGILSVLCNQTPIKINEIIKSGKETLKPRGPDSTCSIIKPSGIYIFNRLAINDLSDAGNQPFEVNDKILMCNGQIYNHIQLREKYELKCNSMSDCEVIIRMYEKIGIVETVKELRGVYAFILVDGNNVYLARDIIGVRPLYYGFTEEGFLSVASTPNALTTFCSSIYSVNIGTVMHHIKPNKNQQTHQQLYTLYAYELKTDNLKIENPHLKLKELLIDAVKVRLLSDRPIGCLLSGGLDSSVIASILVKLLGADKVRTYSVGMKGSTDLKYAKIVADYLGTTHHEVVFTPEEGLNSIPEVIKRLVSFDITTIRASVGMYILTKYISEKTKDIVIFSGEGSDEILGGYLYFHNAPNVRDFNDECLRLVNELHTYDVLRADRMISSAGLEGRFGFLDKAVVEFCLSLSGELKHPKHTNNTEKMILRDAFKDMLPHEIYIRRKETFSDGLLDATQSWGSMIQAFVETKIPDECMNDSFPSKEAFYYYLVFVHYYPFYNLQLPYWLPRWCGGLSDPSARLITINVDNST